MNALRCNDFVSLRSNPAPGHSGQLVDSHVGLSLQLIVSRQRSALQPDYIAELND